jgi:hypothetical protein
MLSTILEREIDFLHNAEFNDLEICTYGNHLHKIIFTIKVFSANQIILNQLNQFYLALESAEYYQSVLKLINDISEDINKFGTDFEFSLKFKDHCLSITQKYSVV